MGIEVLPPDVNESSSDFTVVEGKVRFGLVAVKNVGETAIQSILAARRNEGRFGSLYDFCERVDLRLVNKRVVESLVKCGAFDSLGARRSQLAAVVDKAMEAAASAQRDRAHGQGSLLDVLSASGASRREAPPLPALPEWDRSQLLTRRRRRWGSTSRGTRWMRIAPRWTGMRPPRRRACPPCPTSPRAAGGHRHGGEGDQHQERGPDGLRHAGRLERPVESVVFPDVYRSSMLHLAKDSAVLVKGQVDIGEDGSAKLLVSEVRRLVAGRKRGGALGRSDAAPRPTPRRRGCVSSRRSSRHTREARRCG